VLIEAGAHPFDGSMIDFRPDNDWAPTTLPPHWDLPAAYVDPRRSHAPRYGARMSSEYS
jgi:hypothetical protein